MLIDRIALGDDALDAIKTYLRIAGDDDDAMLMALGVAAVAACEAFTDRTLIARSATEIFVPTASWTRLRAWPVAAITAATADDGSVLGPDAYAIDIDADATGRVRALGTTRDRLHITYSVGTALRWSEIDEPLRQGLLAFVADRYAARDRATDGALPLAIATLWRDGRRLRLR